MTKVLWKETLPAGKLIPPSGAGGTLGSNSHRLARMNCGFFNSMIQSRHNLNCFASPYPQLAVLSWKKVVELSSNSKMYIISHQHGVKILTNRFSLQKYTNSSCSLSWCLQAFRSVFTVLVDMGLIHMERDVLAGHYRTYICSTMGREGATTFFNPCGKLMHTVGGRGIQWSLLWKEITYDIPVKVKWSPIAQMMDAVIPTESTGK